MARSTPTEADLGIAPTEDELSSAPVATETTTTATEDVDISLTDDQPVMTAPDNEQQTGDDKPQDKEQEQPPAQPEKTVDLRALQEARSENRDLKQRNALLEQRVNAILAQFQQPQPQTQQTSTEPPPPPPEDDVFARVNWLVDRIKEQTEQQAKLTTQTAEERQRAEFINRVAAVEHQFRSSTPDYDAAVSFVAESRDRELQTLFPFSTAEQRQHTIREEWSNIARTSIQAGLNPAEQVYNLAKARGFAGTAPQQQPAAAQPQIDPAALASAQQRHQSLSDAGGGESVAPLDAKALAAMDEKAFNAWLSQKGNDKKLEAILGA